MSQLYIFSPEFLSDEFRTTQFTVEGLVSCDDEYVIIKNKYLMRTAMVIIALATRMDGRVGNALVLLRLNCQDLSFEI